MYLIISILLERTDLFPSYLRYIESDDFDRRAIAIFRINNVVLVDDLIYNHFDTKQMIICLDHKNLPEVFTEYSA